MENLISISGADYNSTTLSSDFLSESQASVNTIILSGATTPQTEDIYSLDFSEIYKSLSITAKKFIDKLNDILKADLPNGVQSLKPEDVTAEATAEKIVSGATSYYNVFAKQNPNLSDKELLDKFMATISGGIQSGYDDAIGTLEGLGAFEFEGVRSGVEQTKILISEKLAKFYEMKKAELGINDESTGEAQPSTPVTTPVNKSATVDLKV